MKNKTKGWIRVVGSFSSFSITSTFLNLSYLLLHLPCDSFFLNFRELSQPDSTNPVSWQTLPRLVSARSSIVPWLESR